MKCFSLPNSFRSLRPRWYKQLSHIGICIIETCITGQMAKKYTKITVYETTTFMPITKYQDTLLLFKLDVLVGTLDTD